MVDNNAIALTKDWLLDSGIQNTEGPETGGFNAWFDLVNGKYSFVYSEITGYGITTLLFLRKIFDDDVFLERAELAAGWIAKRAVHEKGGVRTRHYIQDLEEAGFYSFESENFYAFDNGMVLYGLVNLYKATGKGEYIDLSRGIADFLVSCFMKKDGSFYAVYNPSTGEKTDSDWKWSSQSGSYHAKLALGFSDLFGVTKNKTYKKAAIGLSERAMERQGADGRFITSRRDGSTHLHPHAYSVEGLLYAGKAFGRDDFLDSAKRGVLWAIGNQRKDGGIPKKYSDTGTIDYYRSDSLAQILRLGVLLSADGITGSDISGNLADLRKKLLEFQYISSGAENGGFYYGFKLDGMRNEHINSWCSMFALQALVMYEGLVSGKESLHGLECFV